MGVGKTAFVSSNLMCARCPKSLLHVHLWLLYPVRHSDFLCFAVSFIGKCIMVYLLCILFLINQVVKNIHHSNICSDKSEAKFYMTLSWETKIICLTGLKLMSKLEQHIKLTKILTRFHINKLVTCFPAVFIYIMYVTNFIKLSFGAT